MKNKIRMKDIKEKIMNCDCSITSEDYDKIIGALTSIVTKTVIVDKLVKGGFSTPQAEVLFEVLQLL